MRSTTTRHAGRARGGREAGRLLQVDRQADRPAARHRSSPSRIWYDTFDMRTTAGARRRLCQRSSAARRRRSSRACVTPARSSSRRRTSALGISRSPFGGVSCNPYDTERSAGHVEQRIRLVGGREPRHLRDCRRDRRLDPASDQEQQTSSAWRRHRSSSAATACSTPATTPRRPDLPHGQGRREAARRHRRLRSEGRADGLQRGPHALVFVPELHEREASRRDAHRRHSRVHGSPAVQQGGRGKHRGHGEGGGRSAEARRDDRRSWTRAARCCRNTSTSTRRR